VGGSWQASDDGNDDNDVGTAIYRVHIVISLLQWFPVLYNGSQLRKSASHFQYLLKLFVRVDDDDVTLGAVGDVPTRVRRVCCVHPRSQTTAHSNNDTIVNITLRPLPQTKNLWPIGILSHRTICNCN